MQEEGERFIQAFRASLLVTAESAAHLEVDLRAGLAEGRSGAGEMAEAADRLARGPRLAWVFTLLGLLAVIATLVASALTFDWIEGKRAHERVLESLNGGERLEMAAWLSQPGANDAVLAWLEAEPDHPVPRELWLSDPPVSIQSEDKARQVVEESELIDPGNGIYQLYFLMWQTSREKFSIHRSVFDTKAVDAILGMERIESRLGKWQERAYANFRIVHDHKGASERALRLFSREEVPGRQETFEDYVQGMDEGYDWTRRRVKNPKYERVMRLLDLSENHPDTVQLLPRVLSPELNARVVEDKRCRNAVGDLELPDWYFGVRGVTPKPDGTLDLPGMQEIESLPVSVRHLVEVGGWEPYVRVSRLIDAGFNRELMNPLNQMHWAWMDRRMAVHGAWGLIGLMILMCFVPLLRGKVVHDAGNSMQWIMPVRDHFLAAGGALVLTLATAVGFLWLGPRPRFAPPEIEPDLYFYAPLAALLLLLTYQFTVLLHARRGRWLGWTGRSAGWVLPAVGVALFSIWAQFAWRGQPRLMAVNLSCAGLFGLLVMTGLLVHTMGASRRSLERAVLVKQLVKTLIVLSLMMIAVVWGCREHELWWGTRDRLLGSEHGRPEIFRLRDELRRESLEIQRQAIDFLKSAPPDGP